ncbi:unnamed protein product [Ectocarpus sp. 12 AP-2014]
MLFGWKGEHGLSTRTRIHTNLSSSCRIHMILRVSQARWLRFLSLADPKVTPNSGDATYSTLLVFCGRFWWSRAHLPPYIIHYVQPSGTLPGGTLQLSHSNYN